MILTTPDPWSSLRALTAARIALGRAGSSLPTAAHLEFQIAHAQARDAVHAAFDRGRMLGKVRALELGALAVRSAVSDRREFLLRPDLGRVLDEPSALEVDRARAEGGVDAVFVLGDGLSALAIERHAIPLLERVTGALVTDGWHLAPIILAEQARVALGDEIGERLAARMLVVLIGERPGLSAPDSLGLYLSWAPRVGLTDAERNCISNVRPEGLGYDEAAHRLLYLMRESRRRKLSGVALKEEAGAELPAAKRTGAIPGHA